jgi:hypothetical protein
LKEIETLEKQLEIVKQSQPSALADLEQQNQKLILRNTTLEQEIVQVKLALKVQQSMPGDERIQVQFQIQPW